MEVSKKQFFPFMVLKDEKYLMLEVLMYIEKEDSLHFMFKITKKA